MIHSRRLWMMGALAVTAFVVLWGQGNHLQESYAGEVVRFHVLANSDSEADQELKLKVRNQVGAYVGDLLQGVESKEETLKVISAHLPEIEEAAKEEIARQGKDYDVSAKIEQVDFPVKFYGPYHMPAGEYTSLQVRIGEAKGKNWWCVMYPNMCFAGNTYEVVEGKEKKQMYQVFTVYEYKKLIESPNKEIHFKYFTKLEDKLY